MLGNARIANCLEWLGKHGIVADVQPTFSEHGMGFAYKLDPNLINELSSDDLILTHLTGLEGDSPSETATTLRLVLDNCEQVTINQIYRDDLIASLRELQI